MSGKMRLVALLLAMALQLPANDALSLGYYSRSCPTAEALVKQAVAAAYANDVGIAAALIRLHFHDCFVKGCDASVLLDGPGTEKTAVPNLSVRGYEVIDAAKAAIEAVCPRTVSCADILAFAARDSASLSGDFSWPVPAGRRDGSVSLAGNTVDLPSPFSNASALIENFAKKSLSADDMVTLSGAHSIGVSHCFAITPRLYKTNTSDVDPRLSPAYADLLRRVCPEAGAPADTTVKMDVITPDVLDNKYYVGVLNNLGLFTSDEALRDDALVASVQLNALDPTLWKLKFAISMIKMGGIEVLEGSLGEIRTNCRVVNPKIAADFGSDGWAIADQ